MTFGNRLKEYRKKLDLSVGVFARKLGTSDNNIYNYEGNKTKPNTDFLENLKLLYPNLNLNWLIAGEGVMNLDEQEMIPVDVAEEIAELKKVIEEDRKTTAWLEKAVKRLMANV